MRAVRASMAAALAGLAVTFSASPAQATTGLEPGVHADPGSPAAKQYALPLEQARQTGGGSSSRGGPSRAMFGAGIKAPGSGGPLQPSAGTGGAPTGARRLNSSHERTSSASSQSRARSPHTAATPLRAETRSSSSHTGGEGSLLALLGGAAAVLILAGFGGALLRRSHRSVPSV